MRAVGHALLIYAVATVLVGVAIGIGLDGSAALPLLVLLSPLTMLVTEAAWLAVVARSAWPRVFGWRRPRWSDVGVGIGLGVVCFLVQRLTVLALAAVAEQFGAELPPVQQTFQDIAADPRTAPVLVLTAVLLAPMSEEILFRGILFQGLRAWGLWPAALLSAALFTMAHLEAATSVLANGLVVAGIFPLGVAFALILRRRGTLIAVITTHATYNALGVALLIGTRDLL